MQTEQERRVRLPDGRHLSLKTSGPPRTSPLTPAIILLHGLGGCAREWFEVQRHIARFAPVCVPERAGYHGSDPPTLPPTSANIAADLRALLRAAGVQPPYLLVGHSYGGVVARQVLKDALGEVAGLLLVDSVPVANFFPQAWTELLGGSTYEEVVGLRGNRGVAEEEWELIARESALNEAPGGIAETELGLIRPGNRVLDDELRGWQALGRKPLCVVFCDESNDFRKVYEYGVEHGFGTAEQQEVMRRHLEKMSVEDEAAQRTQLALSENARFLKAEGKRATHNVQLVDPAWVAEQVKWVYDRSVEMP